MLMYKYFIYCRKSTESEDRQVLSIDSQINELVKKYIENENLEIVETFKESFSAKSPGRPIFDAMIKRIEKGEADGIIAWHPDRLARNSLDGGLIIYLLDQGKLKDLKFPVYTFENTSQGKFMLNIMFGQSKYYVDSLSENVRRGFRFKLEKGWLPAVPPLGYLNEPQEGIIIKDSERFNIIRKLWELMLSGNYSVMKVHKIANEDLGLRTRKYKNSGGKKLSKSQLYKIFAHSFYYGLIERTGTTYQGKHAPMITEEEFWQVQALLGKKGRPRPQKHEFAFTGIIKCGECHCSITAEEKYNKYGSFYIYYHCTKKKRLCTQRYIEVKKLEKQIVEIIETFTISQQFKEWTLKYLNKMKKSEYEVKINAQESLKKSLKQTEKDLENLTTIKIKNFITDEEFVNRRKKIVRERESLSLKIRNQTETQNWFELSKECFIFATRAKISFIQGNINEKRQILNSIGSNFLLKDKKLSLELQKPFSIIEKGLSSLLYRGVVDDVRTFFEKNVGKSNEIRNSLSKIVKNNKK